MDTPAATSIKEFDEALQFSQREFRENQTAIVNEQMPQQWKGKDEDGGVTTHTRIAFAKNLDVQTRGRFLQR